VIGDSADLSRFYTLLARDARRYGQLVKECILSSLSGLCRFLSTIPSAKALGYCQVASVYC